MDPRTLRRNFVSGLLSGLRVVWPVLSGLISLMIALGLVVGVREGWSIQESIYFSFISGLTIGYGDLAPASLLTRVLAIVIGLCGILQTALLAAIAVKALTGGRILTDEYELTTLESMPPANRVLDPSSAVMVATHLEEEIPRLLQRDAEWARVAAEGHDIDRILSYWTDDAVVLPPGLPAVVGKPALREYVHASLQIPGFSITWTSTDVRVSPDGNLAYMFGQNSVTVGDAGGKMTTTKGRAVTIWRRDADNVWRCAVDIWNH